MVVGSGPGGAIAAKRLIDAGKSVVVLEAGPVVRPRDRRKNAGYVLSRYFWYGGMRTTRGNVFMPTMQAKNLGGGSVWNSAICMRSQPFVHERWRDRHGLDFTDGSLDADYQAVEEFMGVRPVPAAAQGDRNELFRAACDEMGFTPSVIERNEEGCVGSGECFTGCPSDAKLSTDRRGIPEVLEAGGRVYSSAVVDELIVENGRVRGVTGFTVDPATGRKTHKVKVTAGVTVLSAGALATPAIMQKSGVKGPGVGTNLRFHPGVLAVGVFGDDIRPWAGATQGYHCLDFLEDGIKLESLWATPSLMAFRFPGFGQGLQHNLGRYRHMASWDAWVSGEDSTGFVRHLPGQRPDAYYRLEHTDVQRACEALAKLTEMFFSVGADEVLLGVHGLPPSVHDASIVSELRSGQVDVTQFTFASNHVFGSTAMGADPSRHATDEWGKVYGVDGLYVADTGLLPDSPGVNPMMPAMALSHRVARHVAETL